MGWFFCYLYNIIGVDKAPRLSIRIDILILLSDTETSAIFCYLYDIMGAAQSYVVTERVQNTIINHQMPGQSYHT